MQNDTTDPVRPLIYSPGDHVELVLDGRVMARIAVANLLPRRP